MEGYVHSIESLGTVDGPGIRMVVFLSGCPMRCRYCHNPDTWEMTRGTLMSADDIIAKFVRNRSFYKNGGITVSGGEPLMQIEFLTELFRIAREHGVHTCLDTSGITFCEALRASFDTLVEYTDLVMLDIKHMDREAHKALCGVYNDNVLAFAKYLAQKGVPTWVRRVVVPGITDQRDELFELGRFIASLKNVKALDVLPYHTMGAHKYDELGIEYTLKGVSPMTLEDAAIAKAEILRGVKG